MTEAKRDVVPKWWGNVLQAFDAGVQLDVRVRLALDFLRSGAIPVMRSDDGGRMPAALLALDLATDLLDEAAERGLVKELPDTGELSAPLRHHTERVARANVHGNAAALRAEREEKGAVMAAGMSMVPPGMNG